jgi:hypothetical protein
MPLTKATQNVVEGIVSTGSTGVSAGSFQVGQQYKITSLGTTTQSQWNTIAGTTGQTYVVGSLFTAATNGASSGNGAAAVARTLANRFADVVNVKDFGAVGDGGTNDTTAFQNAYNFVSDGGSILVPAPSVAYAITPFNGTKFVKWICDYSINSNLALLNLPGIIETSINNDLFISRTKCTQNDIANLRIDRSANYSGGINGFVSSALRVNHNISSGVKNYEWGIISDLTDYTQGIDAAENVSIYGKATKHNVGGGTWAMVSELRDYSSEPTRPSVTHEFDMNCIGTNSLNNRICLQVMGGSLNNPTTSECGVAIAVATNPGGIWQKGIGISGVNGDVIDAYNMSGVKSFTLSHAGFMVLGTGAQTIGNGFAALTVTKAGDSRNLFRGYTDGTLYIQIEQGGNVKNNTGVYGTISDQNLKENITDTTSKLDDLKKVRIVNYNLKNDSNKIKMLGVVAQELEEIFPNLVDEDVDGIKSVKTSIFIPMLIKAIQELSDKIDELENK